MTARKRLGEMLVEARVITPQQLQAGLQAQLIYGGRLGTNLVELDYITERFLADFLAGKLRLAAVSAEEMADLPEDAIRSISGELAQKYGAIPLAREKKVLHVAMMDPTDLKALDELAFVTGLQIRPKVAPELLVVAALERHYGIERKQRYIRLVGAESPTPRPPPPGPIAAPATPPATPEPRRPSPSSPDLSRGTGRELSAFIPLSAAAPAPETLAGVVEALSRAPTPEAVLEVVVGAWDRHFDGKILVFAVVGPGTAEVVTATGPAEFRRRVYGKQIALDRPHFLQLVHESHATHAGIAPDSPENVALFNELDDDPSTPILAMPLVLQGRVACMVVGFGPRATLDEGIIRLFGIVLDKAAIAMEILNLRRRLLRLPEDA